MRMAAYADTGRPTEQGGFGLGEGGVIRINVAGCNALRVRIAASIGLQGNGVVGVERQCG